MALTRNCMPRRIGSPSGVAPFMQPKLPVKGGVVIYQGAFVCLDADGFVVPATEADDLLTLGNYRGYMPYGMQDIDASDAEDGDLEIFGIERGTFEVNCGEDADAITLADVQKNAYWIDDETISTVSTDRSLAGKIYGFNPDNGKVMLTVV